MENCCEKYIFSIIRVEMTRKIKKLKKNVSIASEVENDADLNLYNKLIWTIFKTDPWYSK